MFPDAVKTVLLLAASNTFMTVAWSATCGSASAAARRRGYHPAAQPSFRRSVAPV